MCEATPGTVKEIVRERFLREAPALGPLPAVRYDTSCYETRLASWDGYIDMKGNRYSIPDNLRGRLVTARLTLDGLLSVYDGEAIVAGHRLEDRTQGWATRAEHHASPWKSLNVERRDLAVYEEVAQCS